ncbi:testis-specific Y-encoded-like protein 1 [Cricetulus griseus]|uniref:Testis-specific Y-encoded-like protein 1 n=1 Tax=Cricetulus griseus TaxID=10029 RepID=A0A061HZA5_CRIGR|nr:testis-specific Y-encoded-like protein 1 [Cricetulus griseus]
MKVAAMMEVRNEGKNENEDEHKQEGKQDRGPVLEKDLEQSCWSPHHPGIQRLPQSGRGPGNHRSKMEELEFLQLELSLVNARCSRAFARIKAKVAESNHGLRMCRMMFFFRVNPYFQNEIVTKDYEINITGYKESDSSAIEQLGQTEHGYANCIQDTTRLTFLNWLCAHKLPVSNRIAEIIMDDLWPNPLYYFPKEDQS